LEELPQLEQPTMIMVIFNKWFRNIFNFPRTNNLTNLNLVCFKNLIKLTKILLKFSQDHFKILLNQIWDRVFLDRVSLKVILLLFLQLITLTNHSFLILANHKILNWVVVVSSKMLLLVDYLVLKPPPKTSRNQLKNDKS
jgi:hypothetical protein